MRIGCRGTLKVIRTSTRARTSSSSRPPGSSSSSTRIVPPARLRRPVPLDGAGGPGGPGRRSRRKLKVDIPAGRTRVGRQGTRPVPPAREPSVQREGQRARRVEERICPAASRPPSSSIGRGCRRLEASTGLLWRRRRQPAESRPQQRSRSAGNILAPPTAISTAGVAPLLHPRLQGN